MGMGSEAREQAADLERLLLTEPQRFTMMQALRLLGRAERRERRRRRTASSAATSASCRGSRSRFPPAEVVSVRKREEDGRAVYRVTVPYYGLYSTMGALPTFYTEELLDEAREDESISRDFLDILNNHLYHLLYAANRHGDIARRTVESANRSAEFIQYCLIGQAEEELRDPVAARAGGGGPAGAALALRGAARTLPRLSCSGATDVEVEQCVERRASVPTAQRCSRRRRELPRRRGRSRRRGAWRTARESSASTCAA